MLDFRCNPVRLPDRQIRGQRTAIVVLQPAPAAVEQAALAEHALHQVQEPGVHLVDFVALLQPHHTVRAADRAAAGRPKMIAKPARHNLLVIAFTAFVNRHVAKSFEKGSVNSPQLATALSALHPSYL